MPGPVAQQEKSDSNEVPHVEMQTSRHHAWHTPVSAAVGGSVGAYVCFPWESCKKKMESMPRQPISLHPRELYRGASAFAGSVMLASVTQMSFNAGFKSIPGYDQNSVSWNTGSAVASGVLGAFVGSTPVENVILTQQRLSCGPIKAMSHMLSVGWTRPWLGFSQLAVREAGFGLTMLYGANAARQAVLDRTGDERAAVAGEIGFALVGAAATHPFDRIATARQDYSLKHDGAVQSTRDACRSIVAAKGMRGFMDGYGYRAVLFTGCALIIPKVQQAVAHVLENGAGPTLSRVSSLFGAAKTQPTDQQARVEEKQTRRVGNGK